MSIGIASLINAVSSHASKLGVFGTVLTHEPKSAPSGSTCCIFVERVVPYRERSGLASVSVVVLLNVRVYANMLQEPQDDIDRDLIIATDLLMSDYAGDIDLGDENQEIDLLGMSTGGNGMMATLGYIKHDSMLFRVADISLPVIINDVWTEVR